MGIHTNTYKRLENQPTYEQCKEKVVARLKYNISIAEKYIQGGIAEIAKHLFVKTYSQEEHQHFIIDWMSDEDRFYRDGGAERIIALHQRQIRMIESGLCKTAVKRKHARFSHLHSIGTNEKRLYYIKSKDAFYYDANEGYSLRCYVESDAYFYTFQELKSYVLKHYNMSRFYNDCDDIKKMSNRNVIKHIALSNNKSEQKKMQKRLQQNKAFKRYKVLFERNDVIINFS